MKYLRYKKTKIIFVTFLISLLLHLIGSLFFLEYGFSKRVTSFINVLSNSILSPEERRVIEERRARKREALRKILQAACDSKKNNKKYIEFVKPKPETKFKPDAKSKFEIKPNPGEGVPARLVAPRSEFGWVIFDDNYKKPKKLEIPKARDGDLIKSEESDVTEIYPEDFSSNVVALEVEQKTQIDKISKADLVAKRANHKKKIIKEKSVTKSEKPKIVQTRVADKNRQIEMAKPVKTVAAEIKKIIKSIEPAGSSQKEDLSSAIKRDSTARNGAGVQICASVEDKIKEESQAPVEVQYADHKLDKQDSSALQDKAQERDALLNVILKKKATPGYKRAKGSKFIWGLSNSDADQSQNGALTKGYIGKPIGEDGTDLIDRGGDPDKRPKAEEMKYIVYNTKVIAYFKSTWMYNKDFYNLPYEFGIYPVDMEFEIDGLGHLINSRIVKSSGHEGLDKAAIRNLRFASPFPPLPKAFNVKVYKMPFRWIYIVG